MFEPAETDINTDMHAIQTDGSDSSDHRVFPSHRGDNSMAQRAKTERHTDRVQTDILTD